MLDIHFSVNNEAQTWNNFFAIVGNLLKVFWFVEFRNLLLEGRVILKTLVISKFYAQLLMKFKAFKKISYASLVKISILSSK